MISTWTVLKFCRAVGLNSDVNKGASEVVIRKTKIVIRTMATLISQRHNYTAHAIRPFTTCSNAVSTVIHFEIHYSKI